VASAEGLVATRKRVGRERAAERKPMSFSDYTLRDIGISHAHIPSIATGMPLRTD
jgi:uncharacterized protein YjiS (DUF1127 family)